MNINKQALLESVNNRIEWFRARSKGWKDQGYDTKAHEYYECSIALEEIKDEIQSGRFDITDEDGEPIDFIKEIDTAYGLASKHQNDVQRFRAALEQLIEDYERRLRSAITMIDDPNTPSEQRIRVYGKKEAYRTFIQELQALSTTEPTGPSISSTRLMTEPTGVERVRELWASNTEENNRADEEYLSGIVDTLNALGIKIPGINAPEGDEDA
jgi:hypothetical protein